MEAVAFALFQGRKPLKLAMTAMTRHQKRGMGKGQSRLVFRALDFFLFLTGSFMVAYVRVSIGPDISPRQIGNAHIEEAESAWQHVAPNDFTYERKGNQNRMERRKA